MFVIALFTVYGFSSVWSVGTDYVFTTVVTISFEEFSWIPQSESVEVSLVWMSSWYRKMMFSVELQFLSDDTKWFLCYFTLYSPVKYIIWYIFYILWKFLCWDDFIYLREGSFIVRPVEPSSVEESFGCLISLSLRACHGSEYTPCG